VLHDSTKSPVDTTTFSK